MPAIRRLLLSCAVLLVALTSGASCGSDDGPQGGSASAEAVVDAHIAASRSYDLAADCALLTPERREQMASFDGDDPEGYCERATREVVDNADAAARASTIAIYTDPTVELLSEDGDRQQFQITAADGSYVEVVEVVEVEGRWWVASIEGDADAGHDHDEDADVGTDHGGDEGG